MAEYIEREALAVALNHRLNFLMAENGEYDHYTSGFDEAVTRVECFPVADVAPVRHGRWTYDPDSGDGFDHHMCTECKTDAVFDYTYEDDYDEWLDGELKYIGQREAGILEHLTGFCPNCGAKMDLGEE